MIVEDSRMLHVSIFHKLQNNLFRVDFSLVLVEVMTIADEVDSQLCQAHAVLYGTGAGKACSLVSTAFHRDVRIEAPDFQSGELGFPSRAADQSTLALDAGFQLTVPRDLDLNGNCQEGDCRRMCGDSLSPY